LDATIEDCLTILYEEVAEPTHTVDILYDSDSEIAGFQFHVDGDVTVIGVSGGDAEALGFTLFTEINNVKPNASASPPLTPITVTSPST
jgi:hypothetical protein